MRFDAFQHPQIHEMTSIQAVDEGRPKAPLYVMHYVIL